MEKKKITFIWWVFWSSKKDAKIWLIGSKQTKPNHLDNSGHMNHDALHAIKLLLLLLLYISTYELAFL